MKIVSLQAENFKILKAVEIAPNGNMITIGGKNGQGKSSVLDAIYVALKGRAAAPPKPVRDGTEKCRIVLDMGELIVTRTFTVKEGKEFTDNLKVETADGYRPDKPQKVLDALLGSLGFDPFEFVGKPADDQAEMLLELVPLSVDLDELADADRSDYAKRTDTNRDIKTLEGQLASYPLEPMPDVVPDRDALVEKLGSAADTNLALEREEMRRVQLDSTRIGLGDAAAAARRQIQELRDQINDLEIVAEEKQRAAEKMQEEIDALPPLSEPIDTQALREEIRQAENAAAVKARQEARAQIKADIAAKTKESEALTKAMDDRERQRQDALAKAKMPIEGLGFQVNEKGKPVVTFKGQPFAQISTAEQIRASAAIAMAANPTLRVMRISDGSLLDEDSLAELARMAEADDFQIWIEKVGSGGVGIVLENGEIKS